MDGYSRDVDGRAIAPGGTGPLDFKETSITCLKHPNVVSKLAIYNPNAVVLWVFGIPLLNPTSTVEENTQRKMPLKKTTKLQLLKRATCASEIQLIFDTKKKPEITFHDIFTGWLIGGVP